MSEPIKTGCSGLFCGRRFTTVSIHANGNIVLRPTGALPVNKRYTIGEKVRIVECDSLGKKKESEGVIVSLEPVVRASVEGRLVERSRIRKWKATK